jgi:DNA-binding response OmpR family regulator
VITNKRVLIINNTTSHMPGYQPLIQEVYRVDMVRNADAGLEQLENQDYDIIIVQENHEAESWRLCEKIRRLSATPLIVISTNASADTCIKAINAGADYFLRKAIGPLELMARVQSLLQRASINQSAPVSS